MRDINIVKCSGTDDYHETLTLILPMYLFSLYFSLFNVASPTLLVSVAGSCFLQWTQKILTINKKLSRYSLFVLSTL